MDKLQVNDPFSVKDRVIAIVGATGILGTQYVHFLAGKGARIVIGDVDLSRCIRLAEEVTAAYGADVLPLHVDVTEEPSVIRFFEDLLERYGRMDVLVNNAQVKPAGFYDPFEKYTKETLMTVLDGNLAGVVICCREACRQFLVQRQGVIINVSSIYGITGADQRLYDGVENIYVNGERFSSPVSYAVSKAGIVNLTRYLAAYYREQNIRVNCLTPGGVYDNHDDTFNEQYSWRTILGKMADKDDYNGAILFLCSDASKYMTGANLIIDGGWTAI